MMKLIDTMKAIHVVAAVLAAGLVLALGACTDNPVGGDRSFDDPLELTGVRWQDPDSSGAPEELSPGDLIALEGQNMDAVASVYFNGIEASFNPALASETHLVVSVPSDLPFGELDPDSEDFNTIRVENNSSSAQLDFPVLPPEPDLQEMSNEYADPGEEVTVRGNYLYLVESVTLPDGTTISGDQVEATTDGTEAVFTIPASATPEEGAIEYTTSSGTGVSPPSFVFRDNRGMLFNMDDHADWQFWNAMQSTSSENQDLISEFRPGAEGEFVIMRGDGPIQGGGNNEWWTANRTINLNSQQWVAPENLDESPENFAVKFELNIRQEWAAGSILIYLIETASPDTYETGYAYRVKPWEQQDGSVSAVSWDGWRTITVPLSDFQDAYGTGSTTTSLTELLGDDGAVGPGGPDDNPTSFRLVNFSDATIPAGQAFAVDNIRVVRIAEPN